MTKIDPIYTLILQRFVEEHKLQVILSIEVSYC